jgi:hypothetical protein
MSGSMSNPNTVPVTARAAGTVKVPYPLPTSTTSHGPEQSSFARIQVELKRVPQ